ncbi:MAG: rhomboid family intramembrane serine protease [Candidatus Bipolaricaulota bacterium]
MIPIRTYPRTRIPAVITVSLLLLNGIAFLYTGTFSTSLEQPQWVDASHWGEASPDQLPPAFNPRLPIRIPEDPATDGGYRHVDGRVALQLWQTGNYDFEYPVTERDYLYLRYGLISLQLWRGEDVPPTTGAPIWVTLLTSMFLHGGLLHLLGNMLYLWIFGANVEAAVGRWRFLLFYLVCGLGAALFQAGVYPRATIPMVGASGAIAGVMGAYLVLFPWSRVLALVPIFYFFHLVQVPAILMLGLWFFIQFFSGITDLSGMGGVAWFAHLGGFFTGALLVLAFKRPGVDAGLVEWWRRRRARHAWAGW